MPKFVFQEVDVFTEVPLKGNPLAVVVGADALSDAQMADLANWTNLSETTFLLKPSDPKADYRVRIFTPQTELPFAGHPTLGTCKVWLDTAGKSQQNEIVQECGIGLVHIRQDGDRLSFAAPPLRRSGPVDRDLLSKISTGLHVPLDAIIASNWVDNGPPWIALMLRSRTDLLSLKPDQIALAGLFIGVIAPWDPEQDGPGADFEVRAFLPGSSVPEDPVTGSLNAGVASWLIESHLAPHSYTVSQGTVLGRQGRVHVEKIGSDIWICGSVQTLIKGSVWL